jgi:trehalose synthase
MREIEITEVAPERFGSVMDPARFDRFGEALERGKEVLRGRTLWHVNSTAQGGGVAEMLQSVLGYLTSAGIRTSWMVIDADDPFFELTKRIHNRLHGEDGDGGELGDAERRLYEASLNAEVGELKGSIAEGDVVVLHDPQSVGLAPALKGAGAGLIWSCHVGVDEPNALAKEAWDFLRPAVDETDAQVFSRRAYVWDGLSEDEVAVIPPCIDAFSPKNQRLEDDGVAAILRAAGLMPDGPGDDGDPAFTRQDGSGAGVVRTAEVLQGDQLQPDARVVVQVSRWDKLKDPVGVLRGFARHVDRKAGAHLVLAGPEASSVTDDPEGEEILAQVRSEFEGLPEEDRRRVHIACLPMEDLEENAAIVNALQRRADVVVQKSLAEGFGLTVAEAMWKGRPVVGSRVGGIQDQIVHGENGVLLDDPQDLAGLGRAVTALLEAPSEAERIGREARERVADEYLAPRYLARYLALIERISDGRPGPAEG